MKIVFATIFVMINLLPHLCFAGSEIEFDQIGSGDRAALVIGNGSYRQFQGIENAINDAEDMAVVLKDLGFLVTKRINVSLEEMRNTVQDFSSQPKKGGVSLFYYSGHSHYKDKTNCLIPIDYPKSKGYQDMEEYSVSASSVLKGLMKASPDLIIMIFDSDFGFFPIPNGAVIALSASPPGHAIDGVDGHGLFTSKLLKRIKTPGIELLDMLNLVGRDVFDSGGETYPLFYHTPYKPFYFVSGSGSEDIDSERKRLNDECLRLCQEMIELGRLN